MSKKPMDYLPLIPGSDGTQNAARPIRDAFQDILDGELYPKKVAEYVVTCQVDQDLKIKENAEQVLQIYDSLNDNMEVIDNAGRELMEQQGLYYIRKDTIDDLDDLKEKIRLKHCGLFKPLKMFFVDYFGLLQRSDLLPPAVKKSVDFRLNENLHLCEDCCVDSSNRKKLKAASVVKCNKLRCVEERKFLTSHELNTKLDSKDFIADERPREWKRSLQTDKPKTKVAPRNQFVLMPRSIEFINCDPGKTYKATVKLLNTGTSIQTLVIKDYPKQRSISIELDLKSKLASGMSCVGTITYKPDVYRNFNELITIRNQLGTVQSIEIRVFRPSPRLIICVIRSNSSHMDRPRPGSARFLEARREALNSTIDCGSCLVGQCVSVSVFVQNTGIRGKFFIITEDEWYSENIQTITTHMEHSCEYLWIYPTFFELNAEETTEINMLFHPSRPDMYLEKFFFICDNNSFQQFEVIGDGFLFKKSYINIDIYPVTNIEDKEDYCIFLGFFKPFNVVSFIITVHNTSSLMLKCLWKFRNKKMKDMCQIDESCIDIENCPSHLAPYCTADFTFKINFDDDGFYSTFFNFFITGVPAISLDKDETFLIGKKENSEEMLTKCVDVLITEFEVACKIENEEYYNDESSITESTVTPLECLPPPKRPRIAFSKQLLNFGILPSGLCIQKNIWVVKCDESVKWKIVEVRYSIDTPPHMEIINSENISIDEGKTSCTCSKQKISYRIKTMAPLSWVSMLLLISTDTCPMEIESLCIITYQVINYEITINKNPDNLLLCPMKILYTGVPHTFNVTIANHSPITGLYYFLKPFGESTEFLDVEITPNEGVLRPLGSKTVEMKITGKEVGIFENLYIPCFINKGQECKIIRVLCAIDTIHLAVYLPGRSDYFQKITWPPKILYEYDEDWVICPCTLEYGPEMDGERLSDVELKKDENNVNVDFKPIATSSSTEVATVEKTISVTENSSNSTSKSSTESVSHNLKSTLQEQFGDDLFLQDFVIEVHQVRLRTPTKLTFFLENTTPVTSSYTVEAINFFTTKTFDKTALKLNIRKEEDIWDDMIMNEYGILVLPDTKEGELKPFGVIEINITVFANTWGIYQEEIAVDVVDIPCFAFSLLIEVVGCPVMFPMALFKITDYPTVRYSFIHSPTSLQQAVNIQLATPQPVNPFETILDANSSEYIDIKMSPGNLKPRTEKTYVTCSVVGRIVLDEQHRKKLNYYFRETDFDCKDLRIENVATLEWPVLRRDFVCGETTKRFYANDIIFNKDVVSIRLVFQNGHTCAAKFEMGIDDPLEIVSTNAQREEDNTYLVQPLSCLEVIIRSTIDHKRILQLSELVYPKKGFTPDEKKDEMKCVESVDYDNRILHIVSNFRIVQDRKKEKVYPINLFIYFPNISAKPCTVRLDQVFLGNTRKALVTVFNETGCAVSFEIFKSLASEILYISPHYGRIEKSTGVNKSFVDIFIYFTPREARQYQESIRIVTNIPNYFIEIIIKASGSINEKFHVDYKI